MEEHFAAGDHLEEAAVNLVEEWKGRGDRSLIFA